MKKGKRKQKYKTNATQPSLLLQGDEGSLSGTVMLCLFPVPAYFQNINRGDHKP